MAGPTPRPGLLLALLSLWLCTWAAPVTAGALGEARKLLYRVGLTAEEEEQLKNEPQLPRYRHAIELLEEARGDGASVEGDLIHAHRQIDLLAQAAGDVQSAIDNGRSALRTLGRAHPVAVLILGSAQLRAGRPAEAADTFSAGRAASSGTDAELSMRLGLIKAYTLQAFEDRTALGWARSEAEEMLQVWPRDPEVRFNAGFLRALAGDDQGCVDLWGETPELVTQPEWERSLFLLLSRKSLGCFTFTVGSGVALVELAKLLSLFRQAYLDTGRALEIFPDPRQPTGIELLAAHEYARVAPAWSNGFYEKNGIRLRFERGRPIASLRVIVYHELAHKLIDLKTGGRCPRWLSEGLVMHLTGQANEQRYTDRLRGLVVAGNLAALAQLQNGTMWARGGEWVTTAYALSVSAVGRLLSVRPARRVNRLLCHLGAGQSLAQAFEEALGLSLATFESDWQYLVRRGHGAP